MIDEDLNLTLKLTEKNTNVIKFEKTFFATSEAATFKVARGHFCKEEGNTSQEILISAPWISLIIYKFVI